MPRIGLGTWPMDDATAERVVPTAVDAGYRLAATARSEVR
jgi:2,5-diketo-D-gluconate reductase A